MSTPIDIITYICEIIEDLGEIRYRKMFGEFVIYVNEKPIILVCDSQVFLKQEPCLIEIMKNADIGIPYNGAKPRYILDIDDADFFRKAITILEQNTPIPKPKKKSHRR